MFPVQSHMLGGDVFLPGVNHKIDPLASHGMKMPQRAFILGQLVRQTQLHAKTANGWQAGKGEMQRRGGLGNTGIVAGTGHANN